MGWGGVGRGMLTFLVLRTLYVAMLQRSLGVLANVYTRSGGVGFKEHRSSPVCEMLAMAICESTYSAPAKNNFNAEAPGLKRQYKAPIKLIQ